MDETPNPIVNVEDEKENQQIFGEHWGATFKSLTPTMRPRGGSLGINHMRVAPGRSTCPFHGHQLEDEAFYILSGRGVLRYGETLHPLKPGDCVSCPAGTGIAHQLANPYDEDLVYLAIGAHEPNEVAFYPDNKKILVRGLKKIGWMETAGYLEGESDPPTIFEMIRSEGGDG